MKTALVLCSGGIDSVTVAHLVKSQYDTTLLLFYKYGQRAYKEEKKAVMFISKHLQVTCKEITLQCKHISTSHLTSAKKAHHGLTIHNTHEEGKQWYFPQRNLIFLSNALAYAESLTGKVDIFFGFKAEGQEAYPDATPAFVHECNLLARLTTKGKVEVKAPLITKDKEDIILLGKKLQIPYESTVSCYQPLKGKQCGVCLACRLRKAGFYWSGLADPTKYA